ncbi:MAG: hypothetical protein M3O50_03560 [Myxococcota bacterium]|nr:hypothetical protein [Myxococcota bacterium]
MRARPLCTAALVLAVTLLAVWRALCVVAGPDIDTDAYAHHMIARAILADPCDLAVHWVWLPLFHYAQVPLIALGGTIQDVRWINVALAAAVPAVVFAYVRRTARTGRGGFTPDATALVSSMIAALCPICMQMGTTAQPEPLFAVLVLGVAIAFQERRHAQATALLAAAVLLRYEAWAVLAAVAAALFVEEAWRARRSPRQVAGRSAWIVVVAPAALILGWAALRRPVDGRWFGFLRDTTQFANDAQRVQSTMHGGLATVVHDLSYYPLSVAWRVLGAALLLVPFGVARTVRQQGARFVLVFVACLGFISLTWLKRSSLGLDRHFVVVVPLYAISAGQGVAAIADVAGHIVRRQRTTIAASAAGSGLAALLALAVVIGLTLHLGIWMRFWRDAIERGWPNRVALGAYLRTLPRPAMIFCDEATLEILSGVDRTRFDRHWLDDPHTWELVGSTARANGIAYVATWTRKLRGREHVGEIVFRAGEVVGQGLGSPEGVAVMRVLPDATRAER